VSIEGRFADLLAARRFRETHDLLAQLACERPLDLTERLAQAWAEINLGHAATAMVMFESVLADSPASIEALRGVAEAKLAQGALVEAVSLFEAAVRATPDDVSVHRSIGDALIRAGEPARAVSALRRAVALDSSNARAHDLLGMALLRTEGPAAALEAFARAFQLEKESNADGSGFYNFAITLAEVGRLEDSLDVFEHGLAENPNPFAFFTCSMAMLRVGDFVQGWERHEFRWLTPEFVPIRPTFAFPEWTGQDLAGKRILLLAEQGFGDTLQFVRYAKRVHDLGAHVSVIAPTDLASLLRTVPGVDAVPADATALGPPDFFIHLMSLPHVFGSTLQEIPRDIPYVSPREEVRERWRLLPGTAGLRAGVVWAGSATHARDRHRSMPLGALAPLFQVHGVRWFSLQKAHATPTDKHLLERWHIEDLSTNLINFEETAAAIEQLDVLVTVDTSVAHLAGALGKAVWLLLPVFPDFRWMEERADSPWYPTMRIFRQDRPGDWTAVVQDVASALARGLETSLPQAPASPPQLLGRRPLQRMSVVNTEWGMLEYLVDDSEESASLARYAEWLPLHLELLRSLVPSDAFILEVGPGAGAHSLPMEAALSAQGHLMLLEQRRIHRRMLRHNLAGNRLTNHTILEEGLLGQTIDEFDPARLTVLKLGASEAHTSILDGARNSLWRHRPRVVVAALASIEARAVLTDCSYRLFRFDASAYRAANFARRSIHREWIATWTVAIPEEGTDFEPALTGWSPLP